MQPKTWLRNVYDSFKKKILKRKSSFPAFFAEKKRQTNIWLPCDLEDSGALNRSPISREIAGPLAPNRSPNSHSLGLSSLKTFVMAVSSSKELLTSL